METSTPPLCRAFGRITPLIFLPPFFLRFLDATVAAVFQRTELYFRARIIRTFFDRFNENRAGNQDR